MFLLVVCPLILILDALLFLSLRGQKNSTTHVSTPSPGDWFMYGAVVVVAQFPLLGLLPVGSTPNVLWGDAESHARVGLDIARFGLQTGWLDGRLAGFPFAQHYPPLGWLLHAAAVNLGAPPIRAMQWLGFLFVFATPLTLFYCLGSAPRMRLFEAALGGIFVSWISPYSPFFGGYEGFFHTGLLSQTIGLPLVMLWMREVCLGRRTVALVGYSLLAMAAHPQLCVAAVVFLGIGLLGFGALSRLRTFAWTTLVLGACGLALYGQGVLGMQIPFGWPADFGWRHQGFPFSRLSWWLMDGSLFDKNSTGALTSLAILCAALSLSRIAIARVRAVLLTFGLGLLLSVSGSLLGTSGPVGEILLRFVQPLRLVSLLPIAAAALVAVVTGAVADDIERLLVQVGREAWSRTARIAIYMATLGACVGAVPARLEFARMWHDSFENVAPPDGYERAAVARWLAEKRQGRIWYSANSRFVPVFLRDALSLATERPIANTGAVGGHVGLHLAAYGALAPSDPGAVDRAEALGIRALLLANTPAPPDFRTVHISGSVALVEHNRPSNLLGSGCIVRRYVGRNPDLMERMVADLEHPVRRRRLLDPRHLTQIVIKNSPLKEAYVPPGKCESGNARIQEKSYYSGHIEASLESPDPFDLVIRVASFSSWRVALNGRDVRWTPVAPGFISIRVPRGSFSLVADASVWRNMLGTFTFACLILLGLVLVRGRSSIASIARTRGIVRASSRRP